MQFGSVITKLTLQNNCQISKNVDWPINVGRKCNTQIYKIYRLNPPAASAALSHTSHSFCHRRPASSPASGRRFQNRRAAHRSRAARPCRGRPSPTCRPRRGLHPLPASASAGAASAKTFCRSSFHRRDTRRGGRSRGSL